MNLGNVTVEIDEFIEIAANSTATSVEQWQTSAAMLATHPALVCQLEVKMKIQSQESRVGVSELL